MKKRSRRGVPPAHPGGPARAVAVPVPAESPSSAPLWFGVSLLVALAATLPAFTGVVDGSTSLVTAAARFLTVAAVAWALSQVMVLVMPRRQVAPIPDVTSGEPAAADR